MNFFECFSAIGKKNKIRLDAKKRIKKWRKNNPEKALIKSREYDKKRARSEKRLSWKKEYDSQYQKEHKEEIKLKKKEYHKINFETLKIKKGIYNLANQDKIKEFQKEWRENNQDKIKAYMKIYSIDYNKKVENIERKRIQNRKYIKTPEAKRKAKIRNAIYKIRYPEKCKQISFKHDRKRAKTEKRQTYLKNRRKIYWENNKEELKKKNLNYQKIYYSIPENVEKRNIYRRKYENDRRKGDIQYAIKTRLRSRMRSVFRSYIESGLLKKGKLDKKIDWKSVCEHLDKTKPDNWEEFHIDHIKPLCSFDLTNPEEMEKANNYANLQWLTAKENLIKSSKY